MNSRIESDSTRHRKVLNVLRCSVPWLALVLVPWVIIGYYRANLNNNLNNKLADAVEFHNIAAVRTLLAAGASPDARMSLPRHGWKPTAAPEGGDIKYQVPVVLVATEGNSVEILQLLLERGAAVDAAVQGDAADPRGYVGSRALMNASQYGDAALVSLLLKHGADSRQRDAQGQTPLLYAARFGDVAKVRLLIDAGADVNASDSDGYTPLNVAVSNEQRPVTNDNDNVDYAAVVERLIVKGANVNEVNPLGDTPLMTAVKDGDIEIMETLLAHGAKVNAKNDDRKNVLMVALENFQFAKRPVIELLLKHGADAHAIDKEGNTVLHMAEIDHCDAGTIALLKKYRAR